jgi:hypothetical protein
MPRPPTRQPTLDESLARLGLDRAASDDDVRRAYRRLCRQCHPDLNGGDPSRAEEFLIIQQAYRRLAERSVGWEVPSAGHGAERVVIDPADEWPLRSIYDYWRVGGFLVSLAGCLIFGLPFIGRGAALPFIGYQFFYVGATAAAGAVYGLGLVALHPQRRRRLAARLVRFPRRRR